MTNTPEPSLEDMFAERERLNQNITSRLSDLRNGDIEWQKRTEFEVLERCLPDYFGAFLRRLRMFGIATVFHDGRLEGGPAGLTLDETIRAFVASSFPESAGFSPKFLERLVDELQRVHIFDASEGFEQFNRGSQAGSDAPACDLIHELLDLIARASTQPGKWHHCPEENGTSICAVPVHEDQKPSWRTLFKTHAFLCHDMLPADAALAVAAVNALPELIALAEDGLKYRARLSGAR